MSKGSGGKSSGGRVHGARSVGAAAGSTKPNGAILDDSDEMNLERKQRFKAWAEGHRNKKLKAKGYLMNYGGM